MKCKICFNDGSRKFWNTIYNSKMTLYFCEQCKHGFIDPYFNEEELRNFYENEYRYLFYFNIPFKKEIKYLNKMFANTGQLKRNIDRAKVICKENKNETFDNQKQATNFKLKPITDWTPFGQIRPDPHFDTCFFDGR